MSIIDLQQRFVLSGGSVAGRAHLLAGGGNQDAAIWRCAPHGLVAVVTDGCSAGKQSEVGAHLVARLVATALHASMANSNTPIDELLEGTRRATLQHLAALAPALSDDLQDTVRCLLLCTVVGLLVTAEVTAVFALGDGYYAVNGEEHRLGPFLGNAPPYLAYGLLAGDPETHPPALRFHICQQLPTADVQSLLIGSDGLVDLAAAAEQQLPGGNERVGPLTQFWTDPRFTTHPDRVRRRLAQANRSVSGQPALLSDDTTLIVVRRREEST